MFRNDYIFLLYTISGRSKCIATESILWNWEKFQIAVENVDNELRYVKDKRFYGAFSLYIGKYTIEF